MVRWVDLEEDTTYSISSFKFFLNFSQQLREAGCEKEDIRPVQYMEGGGWIDLRNANLTTEKYFMKIFPKESVTQAK